MEFYDAVGKSAEWQLTSSHALTAVELTNQTARTLQIAVTKLLKIEIVTLLATSDVNATVDTLLFIKGLEVVAVTAECEAYNWNRTEELPSKCRSEEAATTSHLATAAGPR
ncbi:uncharacterized protein LOC125940955 [Dermacentor silvarum]|uniref:uncharacterized protein LOC125940955 n=1 Tax=Dermacentor silvarum TaxID=543639 RepID=UPI002100C33F|nr:uncharacterized protein LOC125940955 [Dermacentor silvarum]